MAKRGPKQKTKLQREFDRLRMSTLYLRGVPLIEIAKEIGVTIRQVSYDLASVRDRWIKAQVANIDERRAMELAKLDHLERQYWVEFEASKRARETTTSAQSTRGAASDSKSQIQELKASVKREQPVVGDAEFLQGVQWCIDRRIKLLGLDAPTRVDFNSVRKEAERIAAELGLDTDEVLREAYTILREEQVR